MLFVITAIDKKDSLALRMATREAHFAYLKETNALKLGGPFLDDKGEMCGSMMIIEAADLAAAKAFQANDPYVKAGLFAVSELRPWKATANVVGAQF